MNSICPMWPTLPACRRDAATPIEFETDEPFPQDPAVQLAEVLRSMARAWDGTTARLLRQAKGAPADAGLGLVVQAMALGVGQGECGQGVIQFVDSASGAPQDHWPLSGASKVNADDLGQTQKARCI